MENRNNQNQQIEGNEYNYNGMVINGFLMIFVTFIIIPILLINLGLSFRYEPNPLNVILFIVLCILFFFGWGGYITQEPNQCRVMIFFGKYKGTCRRTGFYWVNPLLTRKKLSLRIRNMDIEPIKVNDKIGNPVLIGMVLVWKIKDTYRAVFDIDGSIESFVRIQSDAALREVTGQFAYDETSHNSDELTLRSGGEEINNLLESKINERLAMAGMEVVEARLNYLAYAPEIAAVMLRRQQASAIITAREKIVEGAVTMVKMAVDRLDNDNVVQLSNEERASLVSNLLVVLCADESAQPVINAGGIR